jgi:MFS family permease
VISNTGSWMQRVAQDWLVLELTHASGSALGITTGLQFLPLLLFSLWGGMIADRYPKRRILMATQAAAGGLAVILGLLALTHAVAIWHVYALAFALGLVTVVDNPTRQAFAAEMVGRRGMPNAIALNSAVFNLARIAGPAVAGLVISAAGTPAAFLINAASYGAVLISLKLMRQSELHGVGRLPRAKGQLREAMSYVKDRPRLWMPMVLIFFVSTFGMNFQVTNALMSRGVFHTGAGAFGLASAVFAAGALGGALLAARRGRPTMALLLATSLAFGVLEVIGALMPDFWSFLVVLVPTGLALLSFTTAANSATQLGTTADMRGRVMGLYLLLFLGGTPLGSPLAGWIAETFGPRMSMIAGGLVSVVATAVIGVMLARSQGVRVREYVRPARLARLVTLLALAGTTPLQPISEPEGAAPPGLRSKERATREGGALRAPAGEREVQPRSKLREL